MLPCIRISKAHRDRLLQQRFRPPLQDEDPQAFVARLRDTMLAIMAELSRHWEYGVGDRDFWIHARDESDQMICVEIATFTMLCPILLDVACNRIVPIAPDYCVNYCNAGGSLKKEDDDPFPGFNVFVSNDQIQIYSAGEELLSRLEIQLEIKGHPGLLS